MKRKGQWVSAEEAISAVRSGNRLILPLGCGLPQTLMEALIAQKDRLRQVEIVSGLQIKYPFLQEGLEESFSFRTWQCAPAIRHLLAKGMVKYIPMRQGDVPYVFSPHGLWPIDVALIHLSPPDKHGYMSFGVSIGHSLPTALEAELVIAEVNEYMPRVCGETFIHISQIDYLVKSARPLLEYPAAEKAGEVEKKIGGYVAELIPDGATLQIGIGSIPDAVVQSLEGERDLKFFGMGIDAIVDCVEKGLVERSLEKASEPKIVVTEILGSKKIFDFVHENPLVAGRPINKIINSRLVGQIEKFISLLGAIEVDLTGQVNAETVNGRQISAIGGSFDFLQGALFSPQGKSIIALTSTTPDGKKSRIVPYLAPGSAVTHPRHCVQYIVTEYGVADLRGKSLRERAEALISIAHPIFREELIKCARENF
ncbi:MAG: acetyl-CoA hydrolase/transferase family protein [Thermodesulfobacteriota bacterium]